MWEKIHVNDCFSVRQRNTAQCENSGATERLAILPKIFYILQNKIFCVCLCLTAFPDTCVLFYGSVGSDLYQYPSTFHELPYQYIVRNSILGSPLAVEACVTLVVSKLMEAKCYSRFLACWLQQAVGQELPTSQYPVPLFYEDCYARWLSVAGKWHLPRYTLVVDSLHRKPVRERTTGKFSTSIYKYTNWWSWSSGLLPFLNTWNQSTVSVEPSEMLTVYLLPQLWQIDLWNEP
jgi:hypothetical protein